MTDNPSSVSGDPIEVTPARESDRDAVFAFTANTFDDGDYIPHVWSDWLADPAGALLVARSAGAAVGLAHVAMVSPTEAWLEGMRVAPDFRRQGIGGILTSRALVTARELGAQVARLFVWSRNEASQQLVDRFGFARVGELIRYTADALPAEPTHPASGAYEPADEHDDTPPESEPALIMAGQEDNERIWSWLEHSNLTPFTGGLQLTGWSARALTEQDVLAYLGNGQVWLLEEWGAIQAMAVAVPIRRQDTGAEVLEVRYMDGAADAVGRLADALRDIATSDGQQKVHIWLPDLLILKDAMAGAGYADDSDGAMWLYAHEL